MTAAEIFLLRLRQLTTLVGSNEQIDTIDVARLLRQLILDQHSLFQLVNTSKIPVIFHVGVMRANEPGLTFCILEDGLDPDTGRPGRPTERIDIKGFLRHPIIRDHGLDITLKDVIKYASNVAGGNHFDPKPRPEYRRLHAVISSGLSIGGFPAGIRQLQAIGRVVIKALEPLRLAVLAETGMR